MGALSSPKLPLSKNVAQPFTLPMFHLHNQSNLLFQVLHILNYNFQLFTIIPKRVRKETANGLNGNHWEHVVQIVGMDMGK